MTFDPITEFTETWYYRVPFHRDNPSLAPLVDAYLAGGARPTDQQLGDNHFARGLVALEEARRNHLPPTDPPAGMGAEIDKRFPWVRPYATRAANTVQLKATSGTPDNPVIIDAKGQNPSGTPLWDGNYHDFVVRDLKHGGGAFDGIKVAGGASRFLVQRIHAYDLSGGKPQGFASQRGSSQGAVLGALFERCGDNKLAHGLYWGLVTGDCLVASVVAHGQHGYGLQFYPGPSSGTVYVTHATLFGSVERMAIVVEDTVVEVHNSILGPNAQAGINIRTGGVIHVFRSCVPRANLAAKNSDGSPVYTDCITDDPDLDPVTFRPRNPKVLSFLGDPAWTPLHDYRGTVFSTPVIGAVA